MMSIQVEEDADQTMIAQSSSTLPQPEPVDQIAESIIDDNQNEIDDDKFSVQCINNLVN